MTRCIWQGVAAAAALIAWHLFSDDFATGMLAAGAVFVAVAAFADWRFGPLVTAEDARREVLNSLKRES